jgi:hypothetical protein
MYQATCRDDSPQFVYYICDSFESYANKKNNDNNILR